MAVPISVRLSVLWWTGGQGTHYKMPARSGNRNLGYHLEKDQTMVLGEQYIPWGGWCHFVVLSPVVLDWPGEWSSNLQSVLEQELLGWDWLLHQWVVQGWREYQENCWTLAHSCCSGKCWVLELIKKLWNVSWDMWAHWNRIQHYSQWAKKEILEKQVNDTIVDLYALGMHAQPRDAMRLLGKPKEQILCLALQVKQQWIELVQVALQCNSQHDHSQYLSEQQIMAKWVIYQ